MCRVSWNFGASTSWNPQSLSRPAMELLYLRLTVQCGRYAMRVSFLSATTFGKIPYSDKSFMKYDCEERWNARRSSCQMLIHCSVWNSRGTTKFSKAQYRIYQIPLGGEIFRTCPDRPWGQQPPIQWVPGLPRGVKRPGRGVEHLPHLAPRLKKKYSYTPTPPLGFRGLY
jgi:hypothetical protein